MANEGDLGHEAEEFERNLAMTRHRAARNRGLPYTGFCHNCGTSTVELFCDADCRDDYEQRMRMEGRG